VDWMCVSDRLDLVVVTDLICDKTAMATSDGHGLQIPVIDISRANEATGDEMVNAAARYGFLYIRTNGIDFSPPIVERMFALVYIYIYLILCC